jgi:hypothetical protein
MPGVHKLVVPTLVPRAAHHSVVFQDRSNMINKILGKFGIYFISPFKKRYIIKHFFQYSFHQDDDYLPDKKLFTKLNHPADLFYLAHIFNWDDGPEVLEWIIDSPLCTKSTACLIFWRSAPDYYLQYSFKEQNEKMLSFDVDVLNLLEKIVEKFNKNSFNPYQIAFDPTPEIEEIRTDNPKWTFPSGVYKIINGITIY